MNITWDDFQRVELRVGTVVAAEPNRHARKPAYVLEVDLGELVLPTANTLVFQRTATPLAASSS